MDPHSNLCNITPDMVLAEKHKKPMRPIHLSPCINSCSQITHTST